MWQGTVSDDEFIIRMAKPCAQEKHSERQIQHRSRVLIKGGMICSEMLQQRALQDMEPLKQLMETHTYTITHQTAFCSWLNGRAQLQHNHLKIYIYIFCPSQPKKRFYALKMQVRRPNWTYAAASFSQNHIIFAKYCILYGQIWITDAFYYPKGCASHKKPLMVLTY